MARNFPSFLKQTRVQNKENRRALIQIKKTKINYSGIESFDTSTFAPDQISFNKSRQPFVNLPQYSSSSSKNLCLIYDRFYFDINNGNLVEIIKYIIDEIA